MRGGNPELGHNTTDQSWRTVTEISIVMLRVGKRAATSYSEKRSLKKELLN